MIAWVLLSNHFVYVFFFLSFISVHFINSTQFDFGFLIQQIKYLFTQGFQNSFCNQEQKIIVSVMLRNIRQFNHFNNVQSSIVFYSTQAARKVNFQEEWNNAKPYDDIPKLSKFQLIRGFLPGGLKLVLIKIWHSF